MCHKPYFTLETIAQENVLNILFIVLGLQPSSSQQDLELDWLKMCQCAFPLPLAPLSTTKTSANICTLQTFAVEFHLALPKTSFLMSFIVLGLQPSS